MAVEDLARRVLGLVRVGQVLGVLLTEGGETLAELLSVGRVESGRVAQFGDGIGKRLLLDGVESGLLGDRLGQSIKPSAQVGERGLEGCERRRNGGALGADLAEVILY